MKIGAFAKRNRVTIDTVRHYIHLELLLPQKVNSQFDFDARCQKDLDEISRLKSLGFSLAEIQKIFLVKHLGKMTAYAHNDYYKGLFLEKRRMIHENIVKLRFQESKLDEELEKLNTPGKEDTSAMGIPLHSLQLFRCGICEKPLLLTEASVIDNMVMSGSLRCACGCEYSVRDGVLYADPAAPQKASIPDVIAYIRHTDEEYLKQIYKTLEWSYTHIDFSELEGRILLELGSGSGFFLRRIYESLPENSVYIAVDHDPERIRFLKQAIEKSTVRKNVIFVCCDFTEIPLGSRTVDVICDCTGTSNYSFDHPAFLLSVIERYFKTDAKLFASYILFKNFSQNSDVPPDRRDLFRLDFIKRQLKSLGFTGKADYVSDIVTKGGIYESYFQKNEKVQTYCFIGKRSG